MERGKINMLKPWSWWSFSVNGHLINTLCIAGRKVSVTDIYFYRCIMTICKKVEWLCSNKTVFMETEIWIPYNFHILNIIFNSIFISGGKKSFSLWAVQKQMVSWICAPGHSLKSLSVYFCLLLLNMVWLRHS